MGFVSYRTSRDAIQSVVRDVLGTRLARVVKVCEENQAVLHRYGLENAPANVAKARENAAANLREIHFGETGYVFVVDAHGSIRAHPDVHVLGRDVSAEPWFQEIARAGRGHAQYVWQKERRWAAFEHFAPWDWYIISSGAESELAGQINRLGLYTMFLLAISLIVSTAALLFLTRWFTAPIHALIAGIERIGDGSSSLRGEGYGRRHWSRPNGRNFSALRASRENATAGGRRRIGPGDQPCAGAGDGKRSASPKRAGQGERFPVRCPIAGCRENR
ncbi:MAG: hypothetical protein GY859_18790 [Desulfobacterales bacterium]|nr:hypothetical protein [Desulfobacterales bacterium]